MGKAKRDERRKREREARHRNDRPFHHGGPGVATLTDRPEHAGANNYDAALQRAIAERWPDGMPAGTIFHTEVRHDSWCWIYDGGPCNCRPVVDISEAVQSKYETE